MDDDSSSRTSGAPDGALPFGADAQVRRRASDILEDFAAHAHGDTITVGDLTRLLGDRAYGMLLLLLALPNIIPLPGLSTAVGVPMIVLGAQLALGWPAPRLPRRLNDVAFSKETLLAVLAKAKPYVERVERRIRPRLPLFAEGPGERLAGFAVMLLAAVLSLPIVFGNLPPAAAIALIALGLIENDGAAVLAGLLLGAAAVVFVGLLVFGLGEAALFLVAQLLPSFFSQAPASCSPTC